MKLTEKQALILMDTMLGSLRIADRGGIFGYDHETRTRIFDQIINQQSDRLIDLEPASGGEGEE